MGQALRRFALGSFAVESLGGASTGDPASLSRSLAQAIRYYLADSGSGRDAWPYPRFLGYVTDGRGGSTVDVEINIDDFIWSAFSREAMRQGVSTSQLLQHAALYFVADRDSGQFVRRIVANLN
jgi:hypothetical protein